MIHHFRKGGGVWLLSEWVNGVGAYEKKTSDLDVSGLLHQLGRIAAVDCSLNNWDRLPAAHVNSGNITNWLIGSDGIVFPIDQSVSRITSQAGKLEYLKNIKLLVAEVRSASPGPCCQRLKAHFEEQCGWQINLSDFSAFLKGMDEMIPKLIKLTQGRSSNGGEDLSDIKRLVAAQFEAAGVLPPRLSTQMESIDIDFITACIEAMV